MINKLQLDHVIWAVQFLGGHSFLYYNDVWLVEFPYAGCWRTFVDWCLLNKIGAEQTSALTGKFYAPKKR